MVMVDKRSLTWRAAVEVIIVLWDICEDAESVWDRQSHHVLCVQKSWDSQMIFSHTERLEHITWHKSAIKFTATTPHNRRMNPHRRKQQLDDHDDKRQAPCVYNNHWTCSFNMTSHDCFRPADIMLWKRFSRGKAHGQLTVNTGTKKEDVRNRTSQ